MTMDIVKAGAEEEEQIIKPQAVAPAVDTSDWPLLLKNYEKRVSPPGTTSATSAERAGRQRLDS